MDIDDAFGHVFMDRRSGMDCDCVIERDDGYIDINDSKPYFAVYEDWPAIERRAMRYVGKRVLDVGCGPARHALYLQGRGHDVTGVDVSPLAIKVAKARGLKKALVMPLSGLRFPRASFDSVLMLGNNFALFGSPGATKRILKRIHTVTSQHARILAETLDPYRTSNPAHLRYHALNRARGRMPGQTRIRVRYGPYRDRWMNLLFVSKSEMKDILKGTGWKITRVLDEGGSHYLAVLDKTST
jgi:SAM-dependent methyltransferase